MARCAEEALLAAIEVYNKPLVSYREQTLALLLVNAWEILLKARIVQSNGNNLSSIYQREGRRFKRNADGSHRTLGLHQTMARVSIGPAIRQSLAGLLLVRNQAAHAGELSDEFRQMVHAFGAATIQNFVTCADKWFDLSVRMPYFLPVGFLTGEGPAQTAANATQRLLLTRLQEIAATQVDDDSEFAITLHLDVRLNPDFSGGGSIGVTADPRAPKVRLSGEKILEKYSLTYSDVVSECRRQIPGFKQARDFNAAMRKVKQDPDCAHERKLNPRSSKGGVKWFYDPKTTLRLLEKELGGDSA